MQYHDFCSMRDAAWSAFYEVLKAHGLSALQISRIRSNLHNSDCFNDVDDCLVPVLEICDE